MEQQRTGISILFRSASSVFALLFICVTIFVALFAYQLAPDSSPNANRMIVELGAKRPGFSKQLLLIPIHKRTQEVNGWWNGNPDEYQYLPINTYTFRNDSLVVNHFIDDGLADTLYFALQQLVPDPNHTLSLQAQQQLIVSERMRKQTFYLGTDRYGRDILSRLLVGSRVSIAVGLIAVILSLSIGVFMGSVAGYFGGLADKVIMFLINILWSVPTLLLVFALTLTLGKGFWEIFVAIGLTMWLGAARLIRGQTLTLKQMDYVLAAKAIGASHTQIITRHILPHLGGVVMVLAASNFATAILVEAGLSFLGIGIQPPQPSWGLMIKEHYNFLITNQPLAAIIPGLAIMLLVYSFNILGNKLRDILDVRS